MKRLATLPFVLAILCALVAIPPATSADGTLQTLPFSQNWSNTGLITADDDWSGVPGIIGYRGDNITAVTGADPQTLTADVATPVDVNANQVDPTAFFTGGCTEFELANPAVAIYGSGTADAPHLVFHITTIGKQNINVSYKLRDVEAGVDDAIQQVALHFRVGNTGPWTNVPAAYVADATTGGTDTQETNVSVALPVAVDNQSEVQIRVMTTNAVGNDEATGVDDILITGDDMPTPTRSTSWGKVKSSFRY